MMDFLRIDDVCVCGEANQEKKIRKKTLLSLVIRYFHQE